MTDGDVAVPRDTVERLGSGVRVLILMVVLYGLLFAVDACQDDNTDDRQDQLTSDLQDTVDTLGATNRRLADLVAARETDRRLDDAGACVTSHVRYAGLQELLRRIGERTSMTDQEVAGLLDGYPPPSCDLTAAQAVLAEG